jgi:alpha-methylacyl-CoA racemase
LIRTRTSAQWVEFFAGHEVCFAPILSMSQARAHPHNVERNTFVDVDGAPQPAPAPRFSRTPSAVQGAPVAAGADTNTALTDWGFTPAEVAQLKQSGAVA